MGQCCRYTPDHSRDATNGGYFAFPDEIELQTQPDLLEFKFLLKIVIDTKLAKLFDKVARIQFKVRYGEKVVKEWTEEVNGSYREDFISKGVRIALDQLNLTQKIKVSVQMLSQNNKIVDGIEENFSFLKAAIAGGSLVKGEAYSEPVIKI